MVAVMNGRLLPPSSDDHAPLGGGLISSVPGAKKDYCEVQNRMLSSGE